MQVMQLGLDSKPDSRLRLQGDACPVLEDVIFPNLCGVFKPHRSNSTHCNRLPQFDLHQRPTAAALANTAQSLEDLEALHRPAAIWSAHFPVLHFSVAACCSLVPNSDHGHPNHSPSFSFRVFRVFRGCSSLAAQSQHSSTHPAIISIHSRMSRDLPRIVCRSSPTYHL